MKSGFVSLIMAASTMFGTGASSSATTADEGSSPILRTQDFESGQKEMAKVPSTALELFLQDLNRRKDWDYAMHNGQPGPDAQYLFTWVGRTTGELVQRGYYFDAAGELHRPGVAVPVR
jgi:hypothetical protein